MAKLYNPLKIRLSDQFLLSDFMGCDSVYRYGLANTFVSSDWSNEAHALAQQLDVLVDQFGPCSVSYGFLNQELTARLIKWKSADKPAYHRWSRGYGAAADLIFHDHVYGALQQYSRSNTILSIQDINEVSSPISLAQKIDAMCRFERMITYAESPAICFATSMACHNGNKGKNNFYENRYIGVRTPRHIKHPATKMIRTDPNRDPYHRALRYYDWRGQGWPSYHGKGRRQFHHYRVSRYTVLSDFLFNNAKVRLGEKNLPPFTYKKKMNRFVVAVYWAGQLIDHIIDHTLSRVSVIDGFRSLGGKGNHNWERGYEMSIVPHCADLAEIATVCTNFDTVNHVEVRTHTRIPYIWVKSYEPLAISPLLRVRDNRGRI